jgi:hypothetical protein
MRYTTRFLATALVFALCCGGAHAVPRLLNFQGRIVAGNVVFDGTGQFKFALVNDNGVVIYWMNSADADHNGEPDDAVALPVSRGLYSVLLGDTNVVNMAALPVELFSTDDLRLRVWFNDDVHGFEALSPDQRVAASAYAIVAGTVQSIDASKISSGVFDLARIPKLPADQITAFGEFSQNLIPEMDASKIAFGVLSEARLPQNVALKNPDLQALSTQISTVSAQVGALVSGTGVIDPSRIPALDASIIGSGTLNPARIPLLPGSQLSGGVIDPSLVPPLAASNIVTGVLDVQRIPTLDASRVASGILDLARIPNLPGSQIANGLLSSVVIPNLDAAKIATGTLNAQRVPNLDATKIASGVLDPARIPPLPATQISGGVLDPVLIPDLNAAKIVSGILTPDRIPDLDAVKIAAGTIDPARLPATLVYAADLQAASNVLSDRLVASNAVLTATVAGLSAQIDLLTAQLAALSNQVAGLLGPMVLPAATVVSSSIPGAPRP